MKKRFLVVAAIIALIVMSCNKDSANAPEGVVAGENEFIATIAKDLRQNAPAVGDDMKTKTVIYGYDIVWSEGDQISINGQKYVTNTSGETVVFSPVGIPAQGNDFQAFYPDDIAENGNSGVFSSSVAYNADELKNLPMYAHSSDLTLQFHNICAALKITVPVECHKIKVSANEPLSGDFTVTGDGSEQNPYKAEISTSGTTCNYIEETKADGGDFAKDEQVYIAVPSNSYTNFTFEFFDANGVSLGHKSKSEFNVVVNNLYNVTFNLLVPQDAFCFTAIEAGSICLKDPNGWAISYFSSRHIIEYYKEGMTDWAEYTFPYSYAGLEIPLKANEKVYFRGDCSVFGYYGSAGSGKISPLTFSSTNKVSVSGNIMYLLDKTGSLRVLTGSKALSCVFYSMDKLTDASELELPATTLSEDCYSSMFSGCHILEKAPELPATVLKEGCYADMFAECYALKKAPDLPANSLPYHCYRQMFFDCRNLTSITMLATDFDQESIDDWLNYYSPSQQTTQTQTITISNGITDLQSGVGKILADETPTKWKIKNENGTVLR